MTNAQTTETTTLNLTAYFECTYLGHDEGYDVHTEQPMRAIFTSAEFATMEEAEEFAGLFPKSARMNAHRVSSSRGDYYRTGVTIDLHSNGVNGGVNETGIKRIATIRKAAAKAGMTTTFGTATEFANAVNEYATEAEFDAAIGA